MKHNWLFPGVFVLAFGVGLCPSQASPDDFHVKAALLSDVQSIQPGTPLTVGVQLKMDKDWHTYWKNPGDSGGPTRILWDLPPGFEAGPIQWPYPKRIETPPLATFGYEDEVMLLVKITPSANLKPATKETLRAHVKWLECADVCIPGEAKLSLTLPVQSNPPKINARQAKRFSEARARLPLLSSEWNLSVTDQGDLFQLSITPPDPSWGALGKVVFFPDDPLVIKNYEDQIFEKKASYLTLSVYKSDLSTAPVNRLRGLLVSENGWQGEGSQKSLQVDLPVQPATSSHSLWMILVFALMGGLLLNLMPCVLPVLSVKALSLVNQKNQSRRKQREHGLLYTAGVVVSFWALVGGLLFLKAGGEKLGWGFQLQSPIFVTFLIGLFFLIGLNLLGVFEVGTSLIGLGDKVRKKKEGKAEAFLTGVLATLVATPCTAPFLGVAMGFALSQTAGVSFLVFTAVALGMASPYLILTFSPPLMKFLPKPGPWMGVFKQLMGFLMIATTLWLFWVLGFQVPPENVIYVLAGLLIFSVAAWLKGRGAAWGWPLLILIIGGGAAFSGGKPLSREGKIPWQPFSVQAVQDARAQGRGVFVDFTAAWCLTCQVNDRVVFSQPRVVEAFNKADLVAFKADWTNRDDTITQELERLGRSGVPVYAYYPPHHKGTPFLWPEVLTPDLVVSKLQRE